MAIATGMKEVGLLLTPSSAKAKTMLGILFTTATLLYTHIWSQVCWLKKERGGRKRDSHAPTHPHCQDFESENEMVIISFLKPPI